MVICSGCGKTVWTDKQIDEAFEKGNALNCICGEIYNPRVNGIDKAIETLKMSLTREVPKHNSKEIVILIRDLQYAILNIAQDLKGIIQKGSQT